MFVTDRPGLPAEQHAGSLLRLLTGSKLGSFAPKGRHIAPISEQACGNTAPKMVNISNFAHKFAPQAWLVCTIFIKFCAFVSVYFLSFGHFRGRNNQLVSIFLGGDIFPHIFNSLCGPPSLLAANLYQNLPFKATTVKSGGGCGLKTPSPMLNLVKIG